MADQSIKFLAADRLAWSMPEGKQDQTKKCYNWPKKLSYVLAVPPRQRAFYIRLEFLKEPQETRKRGCTCT